MWARLNPIMHDAIGLTLAAFLGLLIGTVEQVMR